MATHSKSKRVHCKHCNEALQIHQAGNHLEKCAPNVFETFKQDERTALQRFKPLSRDGMRGFADTHA